MKPILTVLFGLLSSPFVMAAIPAKVLAPRPTNVLAGASALAGGVAGTAFSLTGVSLMSVQNRERIVLDIGDIRGAPRKGLPGYYHVEMQDNPNRVIIDLAQMPNVLVNEKKINERLKNSKLIQHSSILLDPTDQTLSLILDLKRPAKAQVFQVAGKKGTSRVVVDLL